MHIFQAMSTIIPRLLIFLCVTFYSCHKPPNETVDVNTLLNFNFENPNYLRSSGWSTGYHKSWSIDSIGAENGRFCLRINPDTLSHSQWIAFGPIPVLKETNHIELKCRTNKKMPGIDSLILKITALNVGDEKNNISSDSIYLIEPNIDWKERVVELNLDSLYDHFYFGFGTNNGNFLIDDFEVKLNGVSLEKSFAVSSEDVHKLNANSILIESGQLSQINSDFDFLSEFIGNVKVVGLGESTHGTSEVFQIKNRIIKYLIEKEEFNTIIFEGDMESHFSINKMLKENENIDTIMTNLFGVYQTEEIKELFEWLKNRHQLPSIKIWGCDMQEDTYNIQALIDFSENYDEMLLDKVLAYQEEYKVYESLDLVDSLLMHVEMKRGEYLEKISVEELNKLSKNIDLLKQYVYFDANIGNNRSVHRDSSMANNINWICDSYPETKAIIWGHNSHISKVKNEKMGGFLEEKLNDKYFNIGFSLNKGSYRAKRNGDFENCDLRCPFFNSYEYYLSMTDKPIYFLPTNKVVDNLEWYNKKSASTFRSVGAVCNDFQFWESKDVFKSYDALIYIENSTPAEPLYN